MTTLFENKDFRLQLTGHDYDFVGIIESKNDGPITFFFEEEDVEGLSEEHYEYYYDAGMDLDETKTKLSVEYHGMEEGTEEWEFDVSPELASLSHFTLQPCKSVGFLSDCQQRGWFLALVKRYCPKRLKEIPWAA